MMLHLSVVLFVFIGEGSPFILMYPIVFIDLPLDGPMGCLYLGLLHALLVMHISLMVNDGQYLFKGMFIMCVSSLERCLSKYLKNIQENRGPGIPDVWYLKHGFQGLVFCSSFFYHASANVFHILFYLA